MNLLEIPLPELRLRVRTAPDAFFDQCEAIARAKGWGVDRRRAYAGPGFDQLNLHLGTTGPRYPMLRMTAGPKTGRTLKLDAVARWTARPVQYDEYLNVARIAYKVLLDAYRETHGVALRLGIPRRPEALDRTTFDCGRISYAAEKFEGLCRTLAVGKGDARERLIDTFTTIHVVEPDDLPPPLRQHLARVYEQMTEREPRHQYEGSVEATVRTMKNATAAQILERLVDLADAIAVLDERCRRGAYGQPG